MKDRNEIRKRVLKGATIIQGITNSEACKAITGQACVDGENIFKYTDCAWAWSDV